MDVRFKARHILVYWHTTVSAVIKYTNRDVRWHDRF